mmetsp:Transcript_86133/g.200290  ORF Transcript_86133/g.200290 Transcript_86133/m.200290 type:complete len:289 (+) Transcript_86133:685-1551(+)
MWWAVKRSCNAPWFKKECTVESGWCSGAWRNSKRASWSRSGMNFRGAMQSTSRTCRLPMASQKRFGPGSCLGGGLGCSAHLSIRAAALQASQPTFCASSRLVWARRRHCRVRDAHQRRCRLLQKYHWPSQSLRRARRATGARLQGGHGPDTAGQWPAGAASSSPRTRSRMPSGRAGSFAQSAGTGIMVVPHTGGVLAERRGQTSGCAAGLASQPRSGSRFHRLLCHRVICTAATLNKMPAALRWSSLTVVAMEVHPTRMPSRTWMTFRSSGWARHIRGSWWTASRTCA